MRLKRIRSSQLHGIHEFVFGTAQEMNPEWLRSASSLLVALGSRLPDMVLD